MPEEISNNDIITAPATPAGRSAIGVIRVSGSDLSSLISEIFSGQLPPRKAVNRILKKDGRRIDEVIAVFYPKPDSYTGEDLLEISFHGNPLIREKILSLLTELGARPAEPGEFTMRAFKNDKLDLTQAEAVNDIVNAGTESQLRAAVKGIKGELSGRIENLRNKMTDLTAALELSIDFVDQDIEAQNIEGKLEELSGELKELEESYREGKVIKEGLKVAVIGAPNVGKSTLFNRIVKKNRAIVTEVPGTTRDPLKERVEIAGVEVTFIDTAGIRIAEDSVEEEGVKRTKREWKSADFLFLLLDATRSMKETDRRILKKTRERKRFVILNKTDKSTGTDEYAGVKKDFSVSAKTGKSVSKLLKTFEENQIGEINLSDGAVLTNQRHKEAVDKALKDLERAKNALKDDLSAEYIAEDIKEASKKLSEITGEITTDSILENIFSNFCIGK